MSIIFIISLLILIIFLFFFSFWINNYRLGDFIRHSAEFKYPLLRYLYRQFQNKNSVIFLYGLGSKNNYQKIKNICDNKIYKGFEKNQAVIHLRVGEVIDNNKNNPKHLFNSFQKKFIKNDSELNVHGSLSVLGIGTPQGYVKDIHYYDKIAEKLKQLGINKIIITPGGLGIIGNKSKEYINLVKSFFENKSFNVKISMRKNADSDLCIMSNSKIFIPSGGGFSKIISKLVMINGGVVIGEHS